MKQANSLKDTNHRSSLALNTYLANQGLKEIVGAAAQLYKLIVQQPKAHMGSHGHLWEM